MTDKPETTPNHINQQGDEPAAGGWFNRFLRTVEWLGNKLPHPVTLFVIFCLMVIGISGIAEFFGLAVDDPRPEGAAGRSPDGRIVAISLMNAEGLRMIIQGLVTNFTSFAPLGTVLVALLGVGVAEKSGLIRAGIRWIVLAAASVQPERPVITPDMSVTARAFGRIKGLWATLLDPKVLVTTAVAFAGIMSNTASELGYVVLIPLGAVVFHSMGRHPIAGLAVAFASVSGGYSANLLIGTIDPLLAGITQEAAQLIDPAYTVHAAVNWYFMAISVFLIVTLAVIVTHRIVEPLLGKYDPSIAMEDLSDESALEPLTALERKGIRYALISAGLFAVLLALTIFPEWGIFRNPVTNEQLNSPFFRGIVTFIFFGFIIPGYVYGRITGSIKGDRDVVDGMAQSMSTLGLYIVIVFFAAQFVAFFGWTNLGQIIAVLGADFLEAINLTGPLVFVPFIIVSASVNLVIGSASAQWAITAPVFVPMLMLIGYSPEVIQTAYRIGDSVTNIVTPMMSYFGLILAFATKYDRNLGIGTIISTMFPYSLLFWLGWMGLFFLWVFGLGLPVGPGSPTYYVP